MLRTFEDASQREIEEDQNEGKAFDVPGASGTVSTSQTDYAAAMEDKARQLAASGLEDGVGEGGSPIEVRNIALVEDYKVSWRLVSTSRTTASSGDGACTIDVVPVAILTLLTRWIGVL